MRRTHLCLKEACQPLVVPAVRAGENYKPNGLWYQVDGDWERWMADEGGWGQDHYRFAHTLQLGKSNVLKLRTIKALDAFTNEYAVPHQWHKTHEEAMRHGTIDWARVAEQYDGLEIAPYQWRRRMDFIWYYGWDCASGVLWRPNGAHMTLIGEWNPAVVA